MSIIHRKFTIIMKKSLLFFYNLCYNSMSGCMRLFRQNDFYETIAAVWLPYGGYTMANSEQNKSSGRPAWVEALLKIWNVFFVR